MDLRPFDPAAYLDDAETMAAYLQDALDDDPGEFLGALGVVARAKGMTDIAKSAGVTRPAFYRSLSRTGRPDIHTVMHVLASLEVELRMQPARKAVKTQKLARSKIPRPQDARLEKLLLEGLACDRIPLDDQFRARLAEKAEQIVSRRGKRTGS